jgi:hypothetical protein
MAMMKYDSNVKVSIDHTILVGTKVKETIFLEKR